MSLIPAICQNSTCGTIFFAENLINIQGTGKIVIQGCRIACPKCGGMGLVPNGEYTKEHIKLSSINDVKIIQTALSLLKQHLQSNSQPHTLKNEIDKNYPELSLFKKYVPNSSTELATWLTLIILTLQLVWDIYKSGKPQELHLKTDIAEVLKKVFLFQDRNPTDFREKQEEL